MVKNCYGKEEKIAFCRKMNSVPAILPVETRKIEAETHNRKLELLMNSVPVVLPVEGSITGSSTGRDAGIQGRDSYRKCAQSDMSSTGSSTGRTCSTGSTTGRTCGFQSD